VLADAKAKENQLPPLFSLHQHHHHQQRQKEIRETLRKGGAAMLVAGPPGKGGYIIYSTGMWLF
jgi:hypothetical protein